MNEWLTWGSKNGNIDSFDSLKISCFHLEQIRKRPTESI